MVPESVARENSIIPYKDENDVLHVLVSDPFDLETIDLPDDGDFEYEFEVEVRPDFEMPDLTAADMDAAVRTVAGTARSMGIDVEGVN